MKKYLLMLMLMAMAATAAATPPQSSSYAHAGNQTRRAGRTARETTLVGYIADNHCGMNHGKMKWNLDAKECALRCAKEGKKLSLAVNRSVYTLDDAAQDQARQFAGQKVKVTGHVNARARTIHVTKIEAAA